MEQPFNLVSNTTLKKNVADYTLIVIGAFLQALSYSLFLHLIKSYREGCMVYRLFCTT